MNEVTLDHILCQNRNGFSKIICPQRFVTDFVDFCPVFRRFASDEWKPCFQWAEGTFLKSGSGASDWWKDGTGLRADLY